MVAVDVNVLGAVVFMLMFTGPMCLVVFLLFCCLETSPDLAECEIHTHIYIYTHTRTHNEEHMYMSAKVLWKQIFEFAWIYNT